MGFATEPATPSLIRNTGDYRLTVYRQDGLTIREILVLLLILCGLAALIYPVVESRLDDYRVATARAQVTELAAALERYKLDNQFYPTTKQGLEALVNMPTSGRIPRNWNSTGYLPTDTVPLDPWGAPYQYESREAGRFFQLRTYGADGKPGGEGIAEDLVVSH